MDDSKCDLFIEALERMKYNYTAYIPNSKTSATKREAWELFEKYYALLTTVRGIRGLESENVVVAINMEEYALRQNTAQAIARCIHKLTIITFEESESPEIYRATNRDIVNEWKDKELVKIIKYDFKQTQLIPHSEKVVNKNDTEIAVRSQDMINQ